MSMDFAHLPPGRNNKEHQGSTTTTRQPRPSRRRTLYSREAVAKMEACYEVNSHPDLATRLELAREFQVPEVKVQIWFQNRRSRRGETKRRSNSYRKFMNIETKDYGSLAPVYSSINMSWYPIHPTLIRGFVDTTSPYTPSEWNVPHPRNNRLQEILMDELRSYEASNCEEDDV